VERGSPGKGDKERDIVAVARNRKWLRAFRQFWNHKHVVKAFAGPKFRRISDNTEV